MDTKTFASLINQVNTSTPQTEEEKAAALQVLASLYHEVNQRTMEFWSGKRTRASIKSAPFVKAVQGLADRMQCRLTYIEAEGCYKAFDKNASWFAR